ncbi:MAG TPA: chemotaxis protein CheA [Acetobacteraceae bacterium]|nr:chemotaxis protein CheA [Acetobacteraceae bacterium]
MDDLLADFLSETNESLAELDSALLSLEQSPDDADTLSRIFRLVHTIKGTCGFLSTPRLERVAHAAENVLGRVRDKVLPVTPDLITTVLAAIDVIKVIVAGLAGTGSEAAREDGALIARLDAIAERGFVAADPSAASQPRMPNAETSRSRDAAIAPEPKLAPQTVRVGVDVLEEQMRLVSELVLARNQLLQLARAKEEKSGETSAFAAPLQRLSQITSDLQEGVTKTRMQPIGHAWNKLRRLVRNLEQELGKKIELHMTGGDTELDRQVLELIKDPLTHMVRNSADHGLERPTERREAGKPETGRITLNALHQGGHIIIEMADDGRGLPVDRIRAEALARGLASEAELAAMSDAQIHRFIFLAGFSTAARVTSVSGRGVGMDVVKTNIERTGGTIELASKPGLGTSFTITIPLTHAIVPAFILESGGSGSRSRRSACSSSCTRQAMRQSVAAA